MSDREKGERAKGWAIPYLGLTRVRQQPYHATRDGDKYLITSRWLDPNDPEWTDRDGFMLAREKVGNFDWLVCVEFGEDREVEAACRLSPEDIKELKTRGSGSGRLFILVLPLADYQEVLGDRIFFMRDAPEDRERPDDWVAKDPDRPEAQRDFKQRQQAFAEAVLTAYANRCAACEKNVRNADDVPWTQACHIISVGEAGPDDLRNGIALCPAHHCAFDEGLMTLADDGTWLVSPAVPPEPQYDFILQLDGEHAALPAASSAPHPTALGWHRKHVFVQAGARAPAGKATATLDKGVK